MGLGARIQANDRGRDQHIRPAAVPCARAGPDCRAGVAVVQSYKPITVSPDTPISEVARLMIEHKIHHVVVTDSERIAGVVSSFDFVRTFLRDK